MRRSELLAAIGTCLVTRGHLAHAQAQTIPVRPLGPIVATFAEPVAGSVSIRPLSDGRLLVYDPVSLRLLVLDSALQHPALVADTTPATGRAAGRGLSELIPFKGDSSLVRDFLTGAFIVLDPSGKVCRIMGVPRSTNAGTIGPSIPPIGFDQAGHLVFRAPPTVFLALLDQDFVGDTLMVGPDSTEILRQDLSTWRVDTAARLQAARVRQAVTRRGSGLGGSGRPAFNPIPSSDDWTVMSDGTIAVVRVRDYHVDWIRPDGGLTSGPKLPTEWRRLTDSMKVAIMDSIRARDLATLAGGPGGPPRPAQTRAIVEPRDLPDFRPPFVSGFARGDADGNLWVRVNLMVPFVGGPVFDVVDRKGELVDRVRIPAGTTLIGFGKGVAYLTSRTGGAVQLSKARIH